MRFEIGIGGGIVIGIGLLALSGGVFCLGLIGGYEIASQEQHNRDVAAVYNLPAPPPPQTAPQKSSGANKESVTVKAAAAAPTPGASELSSEAADEEVTAPAPKPAPPPKRVAAVAPPTLGSSTSSSGAAKPTHPRLAIRKTPPSAPQGHQPYSVQIDAVMDRQGAENMARRLTAGGYEPYIVPTDIGGQTWYKVRVGHYETEEEAHDAELRLKAQYEGSLPTH